MFERFTQPARRVVALAEEEADRLRHGYIGPEHLLLGIVRHGDSGAAGVLRAHGLDLAAARVEVGRLVDQGVLPRPERSDAELLRGLGIDLAAVRRQAEDTFGGEGVGAATWRGPRWGVGGWARRPGG